MIGVRESPYPLRCSEILGGRIEKGKGPESTQHEEVIIRDYLKQNSNLKLQSTVITVGVPQDTVCGRCVFDLLSGKNILQELLKHKVTPERRKEIEKAVLPSEKVISVSATNPEADKEELHKIIVVGSNLAKILIG
jgi:hypothetical protein